MRDKHVVENQTGVSFLRLFAFAAPALPLAMLHMPVFLVLPTYYAQNTEITLTEIAAVLLIGRIIDAIVDPAIGAMSDRIKTPWARRKLWILAGLPLACFSALMLFSPPSDAGAAYFLTWSTLLFCAWSVIDIPYAAWGAELSRDYMGRSHVMTWRATATYAGTMLFMILPLATASITGTTGFSSATLTWSAWFIVLTLPIFMLFALWAVPSGKSVSTRRASWANFWRGVRTNKPAWLFIVVTFLQGIAGGAWASSVLLFTGTLGLANQFPVFLMAAWATRIFVAPLWLGFIKHYGKHKVWAAACLMSAVVTPLALLTPAGPIAFYVLLAYSIALGFIETGWMVAPSALLGDIVDYDTLKTGSDQTGLYYSVLSLLNTGAAAVGGAAAFWLLGLLNFDATGPNEGTALLGLHVAFAIAPAVTYALCAFVIWWFPIDARRHGIIRRRIENRAQRVELDQTQAVHS